MANAGGAGAGSGPGNAAGAGGSGSGSVFGAALDPTQLFGSGDETESGGRTDVLAQERAVLTAAGYDQSGRAFGESLQRSLRSTPSVFGSAANGYAGAVANPFEGASLFGGESLASVFSASNGDDDSVDPHTAEAMAREMAELQTDRDSSRDWASRHGQSGAASVAQAVAMAQQAGAKLPPTATALLGAAAAGANGAGAGGAAAAAPRVGADGLPVERTAYGASYAPAGATAFARPGRTFDALLSASANTSVNANAQTNPPNASANAQGAAPEERPGVASLWRGTATSRLCAALTSEDAGVGSAEWWEVQHADCVPGHWTYVYSHAALAPQCDTLRCAYHPHVVLARRNAAAGAGAGSLAARVRLTEAVTRQRGTFFHALTDEPLDARLFGVAVRNGERAPDPAPLQLILQRPAGPWDEDDAAPLRFGLQAHKPKHEQEQEQEQEQGGAQLPRASDTLQAFAAHFDAQAAAAQAAAAAAEQQAASQPAAGVAAQAAAPMTFDFSSFQMPATAATAAAATAAAATANAADTGTAATTATVSTDSAGAAGSGAGAVAADAGGGFGGPSGFGGGNQTGAGLFGTGGWSTSPFQFAPAFGNASTDTDDSAPASGAKPRPRFDLSGIDLSVAVAPKPLAASYDRIHDQSPLIMASFRANAAGAGTGTVDAAAAAAANAEIAQAAAAAAAAFAAATAAAATTGASSASALTSASAPVASAWNFGAAFSGGGSAAGSAAGADTDAGAGSGAGRGAGSSVVPSATPDAGVGAGSGLGSESGSAFALALTAQLSGVRVNTERVRDFDEPPLPERVARVAQVNAHVAAATSDTATATSGAGTSSALLSSLLSAEFNFDPIDRTHSSALGGGGNGSDDAGASAAPVDTVTGGQVTFDSLYEGKHRSLISEPTSRFAIAGLLGEYADRELLHTELTVSITALTPQHARLSDADDEASRALYSLTLAVHDSAPAVRLDSNAGDAARAVAATPVTGSSNGGHRERGAPLLLVEGYVVRVGMATVNDYTPIDSCTSVPLAVRVVSRRVAPGAPARFGLSDAPSAAAAGAGAGAGTGAAAADSALDMAVPHGSQLNLKAVNTLDRWSVTAYFRRRACVQLEFAEPLGFVVPRAREDPELALLRPYPTAMHLPFAELAARVYYGDGSDMIGAGGAQPVPYQTPDYLYGRLCATVRGTLLGTDVPATPDPDALFTATTSGGANPSAAAKVAVTRAAHESSRPNAPLPVGPLVDLVLSYARLLPEPGLRAERRLLTAYSEGRMAARQIRRADDTLTLIPGAVHWQQTAEVWERLWSCVDFGDVPWLLHALTTRVNRGGHYNFREPVRQFVFDHCLTKTQLKLSFPSDARRAAAAAAANPSDDDADLEADDELLWEVAASESTYGGTGMRLRRATGRCSIANLLFHLRAVWPARTGVPGYDDDFRAGVVAVTRNATAHNYIGLPCAANLVVADMSGDSEAGASNFAGSRGRSRARAGTAGTQQRLVINPNASTGAIGGGGGGGRDGRTSGLSGTGGSLDGRQPWRRPSPSAGAGRPAAWAAIAKARVAPDASFDLDGDGQVGVRDLFLASHFDRDRDGKLNAAERAAADAALKSGLTRSIDFTQNFTRDDIASHKRKTAKNAQRESADSTLVRPGATAASPRLKPHQSKGASAAAPTDAAAPTAAGTTKTAGVATTTTLGPDNAFFRILEKSLPAAEKLANARDTHKRLISADRSGEFTTSASGPMPADPHAARHLAETRKAAIRAANSNVFAAQQAREQRIDAQFDAFVRDRYDFDARYGPKRERRVDAATARRTTVGGAQGVRGGEAGWKAAAVSDGRPAVAAGLSTGSRRRRDEVFGKTFDGLFGGYGKPREDEKKQQAAAPSADGANAAAKPVSESPSRVRAARARMVGGMNQHRDELTATTAGSGSAGSGGSGGSSGVDSPWVSASRHAYAPTAGRLHPKPEHNSITTAAGVQLRAAPASTMAAGGDAGKAPTVALLPVSKPTIVVPGAASNGNVLVDPVVRSTRFATR